MYEPKTALTFEEKIICAYLHYVRRLSQVDILIAMGGVNPARVNDAVTEIRTVLNGDLAGAQATPMGSTRWRKDSVA